MYQELNLECQTISLHRLTLTRVSPGSTESSRTSLDHDQPGCETRRLTDSEVSLLIAAADLSAAERLAELLAGGVARAAAVGQCSGRLWPGPSGLHRSSESPGVRMRHPENGCWS